MNALLMNGLPRWCSGKELPAMQETQVQSLGRVDPLEKEMASHSSILDWEMPWTEKTGSYSPWGSQRFGHDSVTKQQQCYE